MNRLTAHGAATVRERWRGPRSRDREGAVAGPAANTVFGPLAHARDSERGPVQNVKARRAEFDLDATSSRFPATLSAAARACYVGGEFGGQPAGAIDLPQGLEDALGMDRQGARARFREIEIEHQ